MPSRNVIKIDVEHSYYHIYARGASKQSIFREPTDYLFFVSLLSRYLSKKPVVSKAGVGYPHFYGKLELLAYCLMNNHYHLLIYQVTAGSMSGLMRSLMTSYSHYFNLKYKRSGSLFESRYKASRINTPDYLEHISRYIHLNPRYWKRYPYSSVSFYAKSNEPDWLVNKKILDMFDSRHAYMRFVEDYEDHKNMLDEIKNELADS